MLSVKGQGNFRTNCQLKIFILLSLLPREERILQLFNGYAEDFYFGPQNQRQKFQLCIMRKKLRNLLSANNGS